MSRDNGDDPPRWRDADEEPAEPREWEEVEPEEEKGPRSGGVLRRTFPVARVVFIVVLLGLAVATAIALKDGLARWFGG